MAKNIHAQILGRRGAKARLKNLSAEQRRAIARKAGLASGRARQAKAKQNPK